MMVAQKYHEADLGEILMKANNHHITDLGGKSLNERKSVQRRHSKFRKLNEFSSIINFNSTR